MSVETPEADHPAVLTDRTAEESVRFRAADVDGWLVGTVDDIRLDGRERFGAVTVIENGHNGAVYDLETHYDDRVGWTTVTVIERDYSQSPTEFVEHGPLEDIESVTLGVEPDSIRPGDTVQHVDGTTYRVVMAPTEREYDEKALVYDLHGPSNAPTKQPPSEFLAETLDRPDTPTQD